MFNWYKHRYAANSAYDMGETAYRQARNWRNLRTDISKGILFGNTKEGLQYGSKMAFGGMHYNALFGLITGAYAPKGHKLTQMIAGSTAVGGTLIGGALGGPIGALIGGVGLDPLMAGYVEPLLYNAVASRAKVHRTEYGQNFKDTEQLDTMRQKAVHQMNTSLMNARFILGKEAYYNH